MTQIGNVPEIKAVRQTLEKLQQQGLVKEWEVPYEHILTQLSSAIFFITLTENTSPEAIWSILNDDRVTYRPNEEKKLSQLEWRLEFKRSTDE